MVDKDKHLPVIQGDGDTGEPSCSPKIYVSNEEAALLAEMRELREQSIALKKEARGADAEKRSSLETQISELRDAWQHLADQREEAFVRKMIMLGHLPPDDPVTSGQ